MDSELEDLLCEEFDSSLSGLDINLGDIDVSVEDLQGLTLRGRGEEIEIPVMEEANFGSKDFFDNWDLDNYDDRFSEEEKLELIDNNITPQIANSLGPDAQVKDITNLPKGAFLQGRIYNYDDRYTFEEKARMLRHSVYSYTANQYYGIFTVPELMILKEIDKLPNHPKEVNLAQFKEMIRHLKGYSEKSQDFIEFKFLGLGTESVVLLKKDSEGQPKAWKFSDNLDKEYNLLEVIQNFHLGRQKNVVRLSDEEDNDFAVSIEYIDGITMHDQLVGRLLNEEESLHYARGILNGIMEMHQAGVYHNDLHLRNILIDRNRNQPVIIDLGYATRESENGQKCNRVYGGNNDLISLGQILYRINQGFNVFGGNDELTYASIFKNSVQGRREEAYSSRRVLDEILGNIWETAPESIAKLTIELLDRDLSKQPTLSEVYKMQRRFEEVVNES